MYVTIGELGNELEPLPLGQPDTAVQDALQGGLTQEAARLAVERGNRDENQLTDMVFYANNSNDPRLKGGRRLNPKDPRDRDFIREWLNIRDALIRPLILEARAAEAPREPTAFELREVHGNPGKWTAVPDPTTGETVGYYRTSGGYEEMVDLNGYVVWADEPGLESPLLDPTDIIGFGKLGAKLGKGIWNKLGKRLAKKGGKAAGRAAAKLEAQLLKNLRKQLPPKKATEKAIRRAQATLRKGGTWDDILPDDRRLLGIRFHTVVEKVGAEIFKQVGWGKALHYKQLNKRLINKLRSEGGTVMLTEAKLGVGKSAQRLDLAMIDFRKGKQGFTVIDLTSVTKADHLAKSRDYLKKLEQLTGFKGKASDFLYVGDNKQLLETLLEVALK